MAGQKPVKIEDFTPDDAEAVTKWLNNPHDWDPGHIYDAIGYAPGHGGYRSTQDLEPGFLDKLGQQFGIETDKLKERRELFEKQQAIKPLVQGLIATKLELFKNERYMPETTADGADVMQTNGFGPAAGQPGQGGLQPAPVANSLGGPTAPGAQAPGLQPAPTMGDPAMAGLPPGASSTAMASGLPVLSQTYPTAAPGEFPGDKPGQPGPEVPRPAPTTDPDLMATYKPVTGIESTDPIRIGPVPFNAEAPLNVRPEPMMMADRKPLPPGPPPARALKPWERKAAADTIHAKATGHLVSDGKGGLKPYHPEAELLDGPQLTELSDIMDGKKPSGVRLPAAQAVAAMRGRHETKDKDVTVPVREYMASKGWKETPENIDAARKAVHGEKQRTELEQIKYKEDLQRYSKDVLDELGAMGVPDPTTATPDQIDQAIKSSVDRKVDTHTRNMVNTFNHSAIDAPDKEKLTALQQVAHVTHRLKTEFTDEQLSRYVGKIDNPKEKILQFIKEDPEFAKFDALINRAKTAAFETGGKALTPMEASILFGFLPTAEEWSPANFKMKLLESADYANSKSKNIVELATTNRMNLAKQVEKAMPKDSSNNGPAHIKGDDDYAKLPSGSVFVGPDGKTRRKP